MTSVIFGYLFFGAVLALILDYAVGKFAESRGQDFKKYFWLAFFLSPFVSILILLFSSPSSEGGQKEFATSENLIDSEFGKCPQCAEIIKLEARICRYCGSNVGDGFDAIVAARQAAKEQVAAARVAAEIAEFENYQRRSNESRIKALDRSIARRAFFQKKPVKFALATLVVCVVSALTMAGVLIAQKPQADKIADEKARKVALTASISALELEKQIFATNKSDCAREFSADKQTTLKVKFDVAKVENDWVPATIISVADSDFGGAFRCMIDIYLWQSTLSDSLARHSVFDKTEQYVGWKSRKVRVAEVSGRYVITLVASDW